MEVRRFNPNDHAINSVSRPVELKSPAGLLKQQEIQVSVNTIQIPGTNVQFLALEFAAMLSVLIAGNSINAPKDDALRKWLKDNLCQPESEEAPQKLQLRNDRYQLAQTIVQDIIGDDTDDI